MSNAAKLREAWLEARPPSAAYVQEPSKRSLR
jgi:hypothetical protein